MTAYWDSECANHDSEKLILILTLVYKLHKQQMTYVQKSWMRQYWIEKEKQSKQKESLPLFSFVCVPSFIDKNKFATSVLLEISKYHNSILWYEGVCSQLLDGCQSSLIETSIPS